VILVTTGTNGAPFDRLLQELERLDVGEKLVVQHGPSTVRPPHASCVRYVSFAELVDLVREARVVITHGGVGSILVSLTNGKRPLVVPRLARFGEAVDDHQLALARKLAEAHLVALVEDPRGLPELVRAQPEAPKPIGSLQGGVLLEDLGTYLRSVVSSERRF
jgi:UDP-N-acetylglucosamine transferase subunit ALG13